MSHEHLCETAKKAIQAIHSDKSVSLEQTLDSLEALVVEIEQLLSAVEDDIERNA